jgi:uncharacterized protein (TIGR02117 family)
MLKRIIKILSKFVLILFVFIGIYLLAAFTLPYITVNNSFTHAEKGIKLFILSNGVHTDLVVPAKTTYKDWTQDFPKDTFGVKDSSFSYIAFGWGDKGFYLYTPTWNDLTFSTAFKAAFGLSETAMHVRYTKKQNSKRENCAEVSIDPNYYLKLVSSIENSFEKKENAYIKIDHPGYGNYDRFYEAKGTYSLFKTCNIWTNNLLKEIDVKVACWSPFAKGLVGSLKR